MKENVLGSLITNENSITRIFISLCQLKSFREVVVRLLTSGKYGASIIDADDITDQEHLNNSTIPDIFIRKEDCLILAEVKTSLGRTLQDSQPTDYLKWMESQKDSYTKNLYFVFIRPDGYYHEDTYNDRVNKFKSENPNHTTKFITLDWIQIVNELEESGLAQANNYTQDFCCAMRDLFEDKLLIIAYHELEVEDMYTINAATGVTKLFKFVDETCKRIAQEDDTITITQSFQKKWFDDGEYGFYVKDKNQNSDILWFGIWTSYWEKSGSPLCIGVHEKWGKQEAFRSIFHETEKHKDYLLYAMPKMTLVGELSKNSEEMSKIIREYVKKATA